MLPLRPGARPAKSPSLPSLESCWCWPMPCSATAPLTKHGQTQFVQKPLDTLHSYLLRCAACAARKDQRESSMSQTLTPVPPALSPTDLKMTRRLSRRKGLFAPDLLKTALVQSLVMLRPDIQWRNPVMFVVEVGTVLSILYTVAKAISPDAYQAGLGYLIALDVWLFLTVLFANFASALAEARGKAQADALRKTRQETHAYRLQNREY